MWGHAAVKPIPSPTVTYYYRSCHNYVRTCCSETHSITNCYLLLQILPQLCEDMLQWSPFHHQLLPTTTDTATIMWGHAAVKPIPSPTVTYYYRSCHNYVRTCCSEAHSITNRYLLLQILPQLCEDMLQWNPFHHQPLPTTTDPATIMWGHAAVKPIPSPTVTYYYRYCHNYVRTCCSETHSITNCYLLLQILPQLCEDMLQWSPFHHQLLPTTTDPATIMWGHAAVKPIPSPTVTYYYRYCHNYVRTCCSEAHSITNRYLLLQILHNYVRTCCSEAHSITNCYLLLQILPQLCEDMMQWSPFHHQPLPTTTDTATIMWGHAAVKPIPSPTVTYYYRYCHNYVRTCCSEAHSITNRYLLLQILPQLCEDMLQWSPFHHQPLPTTTDTATIMWGHAAVKPIPSPTVTYYYRYCHNYVRTCCSEAHSITNRYLLLQILPQLCEDMLQWSPFHHQPLPTTTDTATIMWGHAAVKPIPSPTVTYYYRSCHNYVRTCCSEAHSITNRYLLLQILPQLCEDMLQWSPFHHQLLPTTTDTAIIMWGHAAVKPIPSPTVTYYYRYCHNYVRTCCSEAHSITNRYLLLQILPQLCEDMLQWSPFHHQPLPTTTDPATIMWGHAAVKPIPSPTVTYYYRSCHNYVRTCCSETHSITNRYLLLQILPQLSQYLCSNSTLPSLDRALPGLSVRPISTVCVHVHTSRLETSMPTCHSP